MAVSKSIIRAKRVACLRPGLRSGLINCRRKTAQFISRAVPEGGSSGLAYSRTADDPPLVRRCQCRRSNNDVHEWPMLDGIWCPRGGCAQRGGRRVVSTTYFGAAPLEGSVFVSRSSDDCRPAASVTSCPSSRRCCDRCLFLIHQHRRRATASCNGDHLDGAVVAVREVVEAGSRASSPAPTIESFARRWGNFLSPATSSAHSVKSSARWTSVAVSSDGKARDDGCRQTNAARCCVRAARGGESLLRTPWLT